MLKATRLQDEVWGISGISYHNVSGDDKEEQDDPGQDTSYRAAEPQLVIIEFYCQFSWATGCQDNCGENEIKWEMWISLRSNWIKGDPGYLINFSADLALHSQIELSSIKTAPVLAGIPVPAYLQLSLKKCNKPFIRNQQGPIKILGLTWINLIYIS